jgi:hypothetical protein
MNFCLRIKVVCKLRRLNENAEITIIQKATDLKEYIF